MTTRRGIKPVTAIDAAQELICLQEDLVRMQERVGSALRTVLAAAKSTTSIVSVEPSKAAPAAKPAAVVVPAPHTLLPERIGQKRGRLDDPKVINAVLDLWFAGGKQADIGATLKIHDRSVRRIISDARARDDERAVQRAIGRHPATSSPASHSSLETSRTQRKDGPDLEAGEGAPSLAPGGETEQSGQDSTEETQVRNEPGSVSPVSAGATEGILSAQTSVAAAPLSPDELDAVAMEALQPPEENEEPLDQSDEALGGTIKDIAGAIKDIVIDLPPKAPEIIGVDLGTEVKVDPETRHTMAMILKGVLEADAKPDEPRYVPHITRETGHLAGFDMVELRIEGPKGELRAPRPVLETFKYMADGRIYDLKLLTERCNWDKGTTLYRQLKDWQPRLRLIGLELVFMTPELYHLKESI